jgi:hypothetical protein
MDALIRVMEWRCASFVGNMVGKRILAGGLVEMGVNAEVALRHCPMLQLFVEEISNVINLLIILSIGMKVLQNLAICLSKGGKCRTQSGYTIH